MNCLLSIWLLSLKALTYTSDKENYRRPSSKEEGVSSTSCGPAWNNADILSIVNSDFCLKSLWLGSAISHRSTVYITVAI